MSSDKLHPAEAFTRRVLARTPDALENEQIFLRGKADFGGDWPDWCGLPMAAVYAILTHGAPVDKANEVMSGLPGGVTQLPELTAALLWRKSKIIYRYDPIVAQALAEQPLDGDLPREALYRMPFFCVFVERKFALDGYAALGFYAWMEFDVPSRVPELRLLYLLQDGDTVSMPVLLPGGTLQDSIGALKASAAQRAHLSVDQPGVGPDCVPSEEDVTASINLVLYLCSAEPDIPAEGELRARRTYNPDGIPRRAATLDVGTRIGAAMRKAAAAPRQETQEHGSHASPVPHIRRAHWHHFWSGPLDGDRVLVVHWLPPIPVNAEDEMDPVIRPIR
ncbi:MAG TPA: hypothetical protein PKN39_02430 [Oscillospiraceae bacterium]|nr:hypothetical protein [Oscillospiraceae bacterium]